jgi:AcrR family transcriptional regulator
VFSRDGFHATSMNDVADAAGVTKPVLYQHFASKRQLYRELLAEEGHRLRQTIAKATRDAESPRQQVERGMAAYFRWVAEDQASFRLLFGSGARRDEEFATDVREVERAIAEAITELIQADVSVEHRELLAFSLIGMAEAASRVRMADGPAFAPDLMARQLSDFAWAGLRGVRRV